MRIWASFVIVPDRSYDLAWLLVLGWDIRLDSAYLKNDVTLESPFFLDIGNLMLFTCFENEKRFLL